MPSSRSKAIRSQDVEQTWLNPILYIKDVSIPVEEKRSEHKSYMKCGKIPAFKSKFGSEQPVEHVNTGLDLPSQYSKLG